MDDIDKFIKLLNDNEKDLFENIIDKKLSLICIVERESFLEGFCMGAKIILEVMYFKSSNFYFEGK